MLPGAQLHLYDGNAQHAALLQKHLVLAGHQLTLFRTFDALTSAFSRELPEILLLVPPPDHLQVPDELQCLRDAHPALLILVLLDSALYQDRALWLRAGADVVLSRPYALEELQAWISSLLRRGASSVRANGNHLVYADLSCDLSRHRVTRAGQAIKLTVREFDLLVYFLQHPEQVLPRLQILHAVWGSGWRGDDNLLDVYIRYLRNKLDVPGSSSLIHTERGIGFVLRQAEMIKQRPKQQSDLSQTSPSGSALDTACQTTC